jgi:diadenosine tetraphosphatase ApaH/serine/threonine PP2A family protein phosphatase
MLIALLSDIHANREAFTACLAHAEQSGANRYIFLGDYVGYGADPGWVVDRVVAHVARGATALLGNHDAAVLSSSSQGMNAVAAEAIEWTRTKLNDAQRDFLRGLPAKLEERGRLFVHANPWAPTDWDYVTGPSTAGRALQATDARQTYCGHVHRPALYHMTATGKVMEFTPVAGVGMPLAATRHWLAVLGSVGQPRDRNPAGSYALLDDERDVLTYMRVPYDVETAAQKIRAAGLPLGLAERLLQGF